jgi:rhombotail lipoprotein
MKTRRSLLSLVLAFVLAGCASMVTMPTSRHMASVVSYLYPQEQEAPQLVVNLSAMQVPVHVGIAFVPDGTGNQSLSEADKIKLLERIKSAFSNYPFIASIEVIPSSFLQPAGGFADLEKVARMFKVDTMALVSYDQLQANDINKSSMLYWTLVGAYLVEGDQYDIQTFIDTSVFDVRSKQLLFRAPGTSQIKGSASMTGFSERARVARLEGYEKAVEALIPRLQAELESFRTRLKSAPASTLNPKQ